MIWKLTGWPLRLYQLGAVFAGLLVGIQPNALSTLLLILYGFFGFFFFHTGQTIPWSFGYSGKKTWLHESIWFLGLGSLVGILVNFWL